MDGEPVWILTSVVLAIHDQQLAEHGGLEGIDENLLESALSSPRFHHLYTKPPPDIPALAAQYAFSIARNQTFTEGNKRTAAVVCETFLNLNGYELVASSEDALLVYLQVAKGEMTAEEVADWIRNNSRLIDDS